VVNLGGYARLYIILKTTTKKGPTFEEKIAPQRKSWIRLCPHDMVHITHVV